MCRGDSATGASEDSDAPTAPTVEWKIASDYQEILKEAVAVVDQMPLDPKCAKAFKKRTGTSLADFLSGGPITLAPLSYVISNTTAGGTHCGIKRRVLVNVEQIIALGPRLYAGVIVHELAHLAMCPAMDYNGGHIAKEESEEWARIVEEKCVPEMRALNQHRYTSWAAH